MTDSVNDSDFNLPEGVKRKAEGQELVKSHAEQFMETMRAVAYRLAKTNGAVTIDDLRKWAIENGLTPHHPNAWGAIFKGKEWKSTGFTRSTLVSNHAHTIRIWTII